MVQSAGAIDGCHIPVRPPVLNHTDYYNRKGWYSVILQAVVDDKYLFAGPVVCIDARVLSESHDARVLSKSQLYRNKNTNSCNINGRDVPIG